MAKSILMQNPVTMRLVNNLAQAIGRSPASTADFYLQKAAREAIREYAEQTALTNKKSKKGKDN